MRVQSGFLAETPSGSAARKSSSFFAKNSSGGEGAALPPLTRGEVVDFVQRLALQAPARKTADEQDTTVKAVEAQRNGESGASFRTMMNWCRANPLVRAEVMRLMGCAGETDPEFVAGISLLINKFVRAQHGAFGGECSPGGGGDGCEPAAAADLFGGRE